MVKKSLVPAFGSIWTTPSLKRFQNDFSGLFTELVNNFGNLDSITTFNELQTEVSFPKINVSETDKSYSVEIAVAGFNKEDIDLELKDNILVISADKKEETEEEDKNYLRKEISARSFKRVVRFPKKVVSSTANANYINGIITMSIDKFVAEATDESVKLIIN